VVWQRSGPGEVQLAPRAGHRPVKRRLSGSVTARNIGSSSTPATVSFLKTMQMRNLVCALYFDSHGQPWMASGQDGQFLKLESGWKGARRDRQRHGYRKRSSSSKPAIG
jgi:hypothetical protein